MSEQNKELGHFFDHEATQETEPLLENSAIISSEETEVFQPIPIVWAIIVQILLLVTFEILAFVLPDVCCTGDNVTHPHAVLIYSHVSLWVLLFALDSYLRRQHMKFRRKGYFEFHQRTRYIGRIAPFVIAVGNTVLLMGLMLIDQFQPDWHQYRFVQIVGSIEVAVALPLLLLYLVKAIQFNRQQDSPDVEREDLTASYTTGQVPCTDIGFRDADKLEEVLEKQADLIQYLKQHNASLGKKIVKLTAELKTSTET